jgi:hypothetical protein
MCMAAKVVPGSAACADVLQLRQRDGEGCLRGWHPPRASQSPRWTLMMSSTWMMALLRTTTVTRFASNLIQTPIIWRIAAKGLLVARVMRSVSYTRTHTRTHTRRFTHTHTHTHKRQDTHKNNVTHTHTHTHTRIHSHTHTHTHLYTHKTHHRHTRTQTQT